MFSKALRIGVILSILLFSTPIYDYKADRNNITVTNQLSSNIGDVGGW